MNIAEESDREMVRFDGLGPLAREAVRNSPRIIDIGNVVSQFKSRRDPAECTDDGYPPLDLLDPKTDAKLAAKIDGIVKSAMGKPIEEFILRPRRAIKASQCR
jgi:hypothetical protein